MNSNLIENLSKLYEEYNISANDLLKSIDETREKLKNKCIPHDEYIKLENELSLLKQDYNNEKHIAKGIFLAREEVF